MSTFVALNIEPDSESEEEIDDTKEIQTEEALKLYQTALKYQSQGPQFLDQTRDTYEALFASEIFKYPESFGQAQRIEYGYEAQEHHGADAAAPHTLPLPNNTDTASNTLAQIVYLSFKNRGQAIINELKYRLLNNDVDEETSKINRGYIEYVMGDFSEALSRDETDGELWRRAAKIASVLDSKRIARFCLEAVLSEDGDGFKDSLEAMGLNESIADQYLGRLTGELGDELAIQILSKRKHTNRFPLAALKGRLDPYPFLPSKSIAFKHVGSMSSKIYEEKLHMRIEVEAASWSLIGSKILGLLSDYETGLFKQAGTIVSLVLPIAEKQIHLPTREDTSTGPPGLDAKLLQDRVVSSSKHNIHEDETRSVTGKGMEGCSDGLKTEPLKDRNDANGGDVPMGDPNSSPEQHDQSKEARTIPNDSNNQQTILQHHNEHKETPSTYIKDSLSTRDTPTEAQANNEQTGASTSPRKRSSDSAAIEDPADQGRLRSKRIRARESLAEASVIETGPLINTEQYWEDQLREYVATDNVTFNTVNSILQKCDGPTLGSIDHLREIIGDVKDSNQCETLVQEDGEGTFRIALKDMHGFLKDWNTQKKTAVVGANELDELERTFHTSRDAGMARFLKDCKKVSKNHDLPRYPEQQGVQQFVEDINKSHCTIHEVGLQWLETLLLPGSRTTRSWINEHNPFSYWRSAYTEYLWSDELKSTVFNFISRFDKFIFLAMREQIQSLEDKIQETIASGYKFSYSFEDCGLINMVETLFELHLNNYLSTSNSRNHDSDFDRNVQEESLKRWSLLAGDLLRPYSSSLGETEHLKDVLSIRYIWASTLQLSTTENISRDQIVQCFTELKDTLKGANALVVRLPNNRAMSELSVDSAEQEISRLSTQSFIEKIFSVNQDSPISVIENLEPILEPILKPLDQEMGIDEEANAQLHDENSSLDGDTHIQEVVDFVKRSEYTLKLFLWRRLREAYTAIDYKPKILSCHFRGIEILVGEFESRAYRESSKSDREVHIITIFKLLDGLLSRTLHLIMNAFDAFEAMDLDHVRSSLRAMVQLCRLLHSFMLYEDLIRIGRIHISESDRSRTQARNFSMRLRHMTVRAWLVLYFLLQEGYSQSRIWTLMPPPTAPTKVTTEFAEDMAKYISVVHESLGLRMQCSLAEKVFLKVSKGELMRFVDQRVIENPNEEGHPPDLPLSQVLFDLHGIKICFQPTDIRDHGCESVALDRPTAMNLIEQVMVCVKYITNGQNMSLKDVLKTELKTTIDKMSEALGLPKTPSGHSFNRRIINAYLKAPINPFDLYRALSGIGELSTAPVRGDSAYIAKRGWYYMLGQMHLIKFQSQKRTMAGLTDDLDLARTYLFHALEHDTDNWNAWYRYGQVFDAKVDEDVTWNADKINGYQHGVLVQNQRITIKSYTMALAIIMRSPEPTPEQANEMSDLFYHFGCRVYAASREPFSMEAFSLQDVKRFCSNHLGGGIYKQQPFPNLKLYGAWKFASVLLQKSLIDTPRRWMAHYMLGKCLWKMYSCDGDVRQNNPRISYRDAIDEFVGAIEALPKKRDSRQDPILEPHFKLVSVVHKLVHRGEITAAAGSEILQATPYARKVSQCKDDDNWENYMLNILKYLRTADKANWHHRMIARAAHVIYDDSQNVTAAMGAKHEFTQQIFTKTMTCQVWKPEHERPGRHFVYTGRYVLFFTQLLYKLTDRNGLDALAKRVRKKSTDFMDFDKIWREVLDANLKLLRYVSHCRPNGENYFTSSVINPWEFATNSAALETWAHQQTTSHPLLDILRDVVELKKLNNNLMPPDQIEDLIIDIFGTLYATKAPELTPARNLQWVEGRDGGGTAQSSGHNTPTENDQHGGQLIYPSGGPSSSSAWHADHPDHLVEGQSHPQTTAKPRRPNMGRKSYIRKAEALVFNKPPPIQPTTSTSKVSTEHAASASTSLPTHHTQQLQSVVIPVSSSTNHSNIVATSGGANTPNVPGSVHDDADDESGSSDLSDLSSSSDHDDRQGTHQEDDEDETEDQEDMPKSKIQFPNLLKYSSSRRRNVSGRGKGSNPDDGRGGEGGGAETEEREDREEQEQGDATGDEVEEGEENEHRDHEDGREDRSSEHHDVIMVD
ncbi:MAG: Histone transcription regulator 3 [Cirrosporium novae-zelandiae]|nr:MAG: Histone transcription regulator 3 [Cirrosporium novae-zelandiae]